MKKEMPEENEYKNVKLDFINGDIIELNELKGNIELINDGVKISGIVLIDGKLYEDVGFYTNNQIISIGYKRNTGMVE